MKKYHEPYPRVEGKDIGVSKKRFVLVFLFFILGFTLLVYRAVYLHLAPDQKLQSLMARQYNRVVQEVTPRGNIYDVNGERLAISVPTYSLIAHPYKVKNPRKVSRYLSKVLNISQKKLLKRLTNGKKFAWLKRRLRPKQYEIIKSQSFKGIDFVQESRRFYPNRELASKVLGAVGYDNEGLGGLEKYYDEYLSVRNYRRLVQHDAKGRFFEDNPDHLRQPIHHLTLTLDKTIQYIVETELAKACQKWRAKKGMAVVIDPHTGAVLAMASYPPFNPNSYSAYDFENWRNLPVTDTFEPGSIFKAMVAAAAIESKVVTPEDKFFCEEGSFKIGNFEIHDSVEHGELTFRDIIKVSSNIGIYKVSRQVGRKYFYSILDDFGFGDYAGIDFPGEVKGILRSSDKWQEIDWANLAFGQGVSVTLLQIASAFSVIANGGLLWRPFLVKKS